ncbi:hypothetical protein ACUXV3_18140 [Roseobacteraceae bacterium NS-SX3]
MKTTLMPAAALLLALAGCTDTASLQTPGNAPHEVSQQVTLTAEGQQKTVIAVTPVSIKFHEARSYSAVPAAFQPKECTLTSTYFSAQVPVPSTVHLPAYGPDTPPMKVRCQSDQFKFDETIKAVNLTQRAVNAAAAAHVLVGFGLVGAAVTAGQASARDKSKDLYGYPTPIMLK